MGPALAGVVAVAAVALASGQIASPLQSRASEGSDFLLPAVSLLERADLKALYRPGTDAPLWVDAAGRPTERAREALALLDRVADDGLDPGDFRASTLEGLASAMAAHPPLADTSRFDVTLSLGVLRYFRQLHLGRVDPRTIGFRMPARTEQHDFAALLRAGLAGGPLAQVADELSPPFEQYRALRRMLSRYRSLAEDAMLPALPPRTIVLRPGGRYTNLGALSRRLIALGDLSGYPPPPDAAAIYDDALVDAVKQFQARHGLLSDGVVGPATHAALECPLAWRVRQIELALERLRWLPDLGRDRLIAVNIPMFRLWAWDAIPSANPATLDMSVIVGRAFDTETPTLVEEMRRVIFRPYWYVPTSILRAEILPALRRSPDYLRRQDMEIFEGPVDAAQPVPTTPETLRRLRNGALNLRQRPGPRNPLGLVKFIFPNDQHVYLHGTPEPELFRKTRRDFSHGCVRVEDPVAMAEWVLRDEPGWTREAILAAMAAPDPLRVDLARPIRVVFFYSTAVVTPEDGLVRFANDIYGQDVKLDGALARRPPRH
jgi:murein L,D-transpeptidase YcbB/YkuD